MADGKRAGARRGARAPVRLRPAVAAYAGAIVASAALWGYLVFLAIRWGADARAGEGPGWAAFALVAAAAVAVLFGGLMLVGRLTRALGLSDTPGPPAAGPTAGHTGSHSARH